VLPDLAAHTLASHHLSMGMPGHVIDAAMFALAEVLEQSDADFASGRAKAQPAEARCRNGITTNETIF